MAAGFAVIPRFRCRHAASLTAAALAAGVAAGLVVAVPTATPAVASASQPTYQRACPPPRPGHAACYAEYRPASPTAQARPDALPSGYGPSDLQSAYRLPSQTAGVGRLVAVVDAFDLPDAESILGTYRSTFGLPACTTANGCFQKVNQRGDATPANLPPTPPVDDNWGIETALDLEMVSAACPKCAILLVEADNDDTGNLAIAAHEAALFANAVSNSYGSQEDSHEHLLDPFYSVRGVVYTAAAGDEGYGPQYPASTADVVAVGGTTLTRDPSVPRGWTEQAWSGSGSGCSAYEAKPSWQSDTGCGQRTETDVSAVANPSAGVAAFAPLGGIGSNSWGVLGGTSAAAPLVAGAYMLAGGSPVLRASRLPYDRAGAHLNDVTQGTNSATCTDGYLCTAGPGYDGPTGMGTPNGVTDFRSIAGVADFDAVGATELGVYRPSARRWYVRGSSYYPVTFGTAGDLVVPADYNGDTFVDTAMYRPSNHRWYIQGGQSVTWGTNGDIPVPADYNGDGTADIAMFRPSNRTWYEYGIGAVAWGERNDIPVPADYNGDGKAEQAVFRPSTGTWWVRGVETVQFGTNGDIPVPGDYNGDGKADIAVFRPSTGAWYVRGAATKVWGTRHDIPVPGDYNGDGRTDIAVFRPSTGYWYVAGGATTRFGQQGDVPLVLPYAAYRVAASS